MAKAYTTMVLRDDPSVVDYVEFLRDELEDEKLVQKALTQPFYANYRTYQRYGGPSESLQHIPVPVSYSETVAKAIEISRRYPEEPDEAVLQRILFNHLQVKEPPHMNIKEKHNG